MGFLRLVFVTSILIAVSSVLLQRFYPDTVDEMVSHPLVFQYSSKITKFSRDVDNYCREVIGPTYDSALETLQPLINMVMPSITTGKSKTEAKKKVSKKEKKGKSERIMTTEELKHYDGSEGSKGLYIAFLGLVFDVSKGVKYYGPGGGYSFFAARDASRAFVTGKFDEEGLIDDIEGLTAQDYIGLEEWIAFYKKDYTYIGKLVGRYYNSDGTATEYKTRADGWVADAVAEQKRLEAEEDQFPGCNSEWNPDTGSRVWCTKLSGGIERDWVGVPRQLFSPGKSTPRCACVKDKGAPNTAGAANTNRGDLDHPHIKEYVDCPRTSDSCYLPKE